MSRALTAGVLYFAIVLAVGLVLGTLRVLLIAPGLGETAAVAAELPVMLAIAWLACGAIVRRIAVPGRAGPRLAMGGVAFLLLIAAEMALGALLLGRTPPEQLAAYRETPALLGLIAQAVFGLMPLIGLRHGSVEH